MLVVSVVAPSSPWTSFDEDNRRFRRVLVPLLAIFTVLSLIMPFLPVPQLTRERQEALPPRLAKVIMEQRKPIPPPPPPVQVQPIQAEKPPPKPEPKAEPKSEPKGVAAPPKQSAAPKPVPTAKEAVARVGLLAMRNELAELRESNTLRSFKDAPNQLIRSAPAKANVAAPIVEDVSLGSGGIDVSRLSRNVGKTELAGHSTAAVSAGAAGGNDETVGNNKKRSRGRTVEDIQLTLQSHKGSFDILYSKALRNNSALKGRVVFELTIAPSGEVVQCKILGSELNEPELERRFLVKLRSINFGVKDVETTVISYPLDFFPS